MSFFNADEYVEKPREQGKQGWYKATIVSMDLKTSESSGSDSWRIKFNLDDFGREVNLSLLWNHHKEEVTQNFRAKLATMAWSCGLTTFKDADDMAMRLAGKTLFIKIGPQKSKPEYLNFLDSCSLKSEHRTGGKISFVVEKPEAKSGNDVPF